jgi:hypothetical protein
MPIRKRNNQWQVDLTTSEGVRLRKSFPTKAEASKYAVSLRVSKPSKKHRKAQSPMSLRSTPSRAGRDARASQKQS